MGVERVSFRLPTHRLTNLQLPSRQRKLCSIQHPVTFEWIRVGARIAEITCLTLFSPSSPYSILTLCFSRLLFAQLRNVNSVLFRFTLYWNVWLSILFIGTENWLYLFSQLVDCCTYSSLFLFSVTRHTEMWTWWNFSSMHKIQMFSSVAASSFSCLVYMLHHKIRHILILFAHSQLQVTTRCESVWKVFDSLLSHSCCAGPKKFIGILFVW